MYSHYGISLVQDISGIIFNIVYTSEFKLDFKWDEDIFIFNCVKLLCKWHCICHPMHEFELYRRWFHHENLKHHNVHCNQVCQYFQSIASQADPSYLNHSEQYANILVHSIAGANGRCWSISTTCVKACNVYISHTLSTHRLGLRST